MSDKHHIQKLIDSHKRRLQKLKEQQAARGWDTPPHILIEIEDIEATIAQLEMAVAEGAVGVDVVQPVWSDQGSTHTTFIQIQLLGQRELLTADRQKVLVNSLAQIGRLAPGEVRLARLKSEGEAVWVCLEIGTTGGDKLSQLFNSNHADLNPLRAEFRLGRLGLLPVDWPDAPDPVYLSLLRLLYLGADRVLIEQELGGGYGGALVLLAQPIYAQGHPGARQIVKIARAAELRGEYDNTQATARDLPLTAARTDSYAEFNGLAGLTYTFMGDGMLGQTRTFEAYVQDPQVSIESIKKTLRDLLDTGLGASWYGQTHPYNCRFDQEYGPHLVEHLRVKLRPSSLDDLWPAAQAVAAIKDYTPLENHQIAPQHQTILPGALVRLDNLEVVRVKAHELKLQQPDNPGVVVRVEWQPGRALKPPLAPGERVSLRGEVVYNRQQRLDTLVKTALAGWPGVTVQVESESLAWGATRCPNPLSLYPEVLRRILRGRQSFVHGDLHLRNILVDHAGRGWLIDFARVAQRHNLFDFIKLETYLRLMLLGRQEITFSPDEYIRFEEALAAATRGDRGVVGPDNTHLRQAYELILEIRYIARMYMGPHPDFRNEYLPALFLYNLAVLKYFQADHPQPARLAVLTAAVVGQSLTETMADGLVVSPPPPAGSWPPTLPWHEPYYPLPDRDQEMARIVAALGKKEERWGVFVSGLGGIGKTATALEIGRRCVAAGVFERVLGTSAKLEFLVDGRIASADARATLDFESFLNELGAQLDRPDLRVMPLAEKRHVLQNLLERVPYLVIIDNLETAPDAVQIVRETPPLLGGRSRALITSREIVSNTAIPLSLAGLSEADSLRFLREEAESRRCDDLNHAPENLLREIHQAVGGQPLALKLLVGQTVNFGLDGALQKMRQGHENFYRFIYWDSWQKLSLPAQKILIYLGKSPASVSLRELLYGPFGIKADNELQVAVEELINLSLVNVIPLSGGRRYAIHQITRQFVTSDLPKLWKQAQGS